MDIEAFLLSLDDKMIKKQLEIPLARIAKMFTQGVSEESAIELVYQFSKHYIAIVPSCLKDLGRLSEHFGLEAIVEPCLQFSRKYLLSTQQSIEETTSDSLKQYLSLLGSAYIAHRLAEELDDRVQNFIGIPITSIDRVNANLIGHELMGDRFSNKIDKAILSIFQQSIITKTIVEAQLNKDAIKLQQNERGSLSGAKVTCLASENGLNMHF